MNTNEVRTTVKARYTEIANQSCCVSAQRCGCGDEDPDTEHRSVALDFPRDIARTSLGCGTPIALAQLVPGEIVLDLGSGGGLDCFSAARAVGETGKVIGVDMTEEMIGLARRNRDKLRLENVEFREGYIERLPVESKSVDVVTSNCVINLSADKQAVFQEALRVLRPGGRLVVSDIVSEGRLPEPIARDPDAWAACIAGAVSVAVYTEMMMRAGFDDIEVLEKHDYAPAEWDRKSSASLSRIILRGVRPQQGDG